MIHLMEDHSNVDLTIGLVLGVSSSVFIGTSFIFKKKALVKLSLRAGKRTIK